MFTSVTMATYDVYISKHFNIYDENFVDTMKLLSDTITSDPDDRTYYSCCYNCLYLAGDADETMMVIGCCHGVTDYLVMLHPSVESSRVRWVDPTVTPETSCYQATLVTSSDSGT